MSTEFKKFDDEKLMSQLIPPSLDRAISAVLTYGSQKYGPRNWEKGTEWGRIYRAAKDHMSKFWEGEDLDDESKLPHLWHAATCITFLIEYFETGTGMDDRQEKRPRRDFSHAIQSAIRIAKERTDEPS